MNYLVLMQIRQPPQHALSYLTKHPLTSTPAPFADLTVNAIQTPPLTKLHSQGNLTLRMINKRAIIPADIIRSTILVEADLAKDLFAHVWVRVCDYHL